MSLSTSLRSLTHRIIVNSSVTTSRNSVARHFSTSLPRHTLARPHPQPPKAPVPFFTARTYTAGGGNTNPRKNQFPVLSILAILAGGSGLFYLLVQSRKANTTASTFSPRKVEPIPAIEDKPKKSRASNTTNNATFSPGEVSVIFVLGGPGAGKGTQCQNLVRDYGFVHLSAGDLLRAEQNRPESEFGELIKTYIREGRIVPMEVTVALLENAMKEAISKDKKYKFLIDGFPRQMDQALKFEEAVCPSKLVLFFDCPEEVMEKRLLKRGQTSGRIDDNIESIRKRFRTFVETSYPVVEYYDKLGKVVKVDATNTPEGVYSNVKKELAGVLQSKP